MNGRLFGYARVSVASDADANNIEHRRRLLADCEQVFEDVGNRRVELRRTIPHPVVPLLEV